MIEYPQIDPVAISLGPLKVHWYGLMYLVGFAGAWWLGKKRTARADSPVNEEQLSDLIFYSALGVILGGRFGYVFFYNFDKFLESPLWALKVWEGGMSFHGGLLGVLAVMFWFSRKLNTTFFKLADFVAPLVPIGLGAGRVGNFIGAELYGRVTDLSIAMKFPIYENIDGVRTLVAWTEPRHPSQLYQFALEGVALFCILWFYSAKPRPTAAVSGVFLTSYGLFRFIVEFARQPDAHIGFIAWDWLTMGQLLSLPMVLVGIGMTVWAYKRDER